MAINVYTGRMGSGKTFEVVREVVLPAILAGRRVVSNIRGLNEKLIHEYLRRHNKNHKGELGTILVVEDDDVSRPDFFYADDLPNPVVQRGDLVVIDEAWRWWIKGTASKMTEAHMQFFRMHRHYVDDKGTPCDLVMIFQSITDVHPFIRSVVEMTTRTVKLKTLGLHSKYRVEIYEGDRIHKNTRVRNIARSYDKRVFPLYQSYAGKQGNEVVVDDRQNVFKNKTLYVGLMAVVLVMGFALHTLFKMFRPVERVEKPVEVQQTGFVAPAEGAAPSDKAASAPVQQTQFSTDLRVSGSVSVSGKTFNLVVDRRGVYRMVEVDDPQTRFRAAELTVDGRKVTPFSGDGGVPGSSPKGN